MVVDEGEALNLDGGLMEWQAFSGVALGRPHQIWVFDIDGVMLDTSSVIIGGTVQSKTEHSGRPAKSLFSSVPRSWASYCGIGRL